MEQKTPLLQLDHVTMEFSSSKGVFAKKEKNTALADFSLDIMPGEMIAVVGESGCGKTTIGKLINHVYEPTKGSIRFEGQDLSSIKKNSAEYKKYRLAVQMVHQDSYAALNPSHTIFQSLSAPLLVHGFSKNRLEALEELVKLFGMVGLTPAEDFLFKYPHQLSGGQRQRVLLARALSVKPRLIVADEPVSMVDVSLRISLLSLMSRMNRELGTAFVYITHDLATARYVAQNGRLVVMYLGKAVEIGDLNEVLLNPRHPYLQALLSAIPDLSERELGKRSKLLLKNVDIADGGTSVGCRFCPRCLYSREICEKSEPELCRVGEELIACHCVEDVPKWKWRE